MKEREPVAVDDALLAAWPLPRPGDDADKEERGRVLVLAGSREMPGAAVLAATAALRAGAGKLVIATVRSAAPMVAAGVPEARVLALPESAAGGPLLEGLASLREVALRADAAVIGPGMIDQECTVAFVQALLPLMQRATVVLDALALEVLHSLGCFGQSVVLTPHAGEMAQLADAGKEEILATPECTARGLAQRARAVVALKGAVTCIGDAQSRLWRHESQCPGLGTSGSGDVLAGLIGGLAARGATPQQATVWGVALHARAGEKLARQLGSLGFLARELAAEVPRLMEQADAVPAPASLHFPRAEEEARQDPREPGRSVAGLAAGRS